MWIFHSSPCLSMTDMSRFYNQMSEKGYQLDKSTFFADHFVKCKEPRYRYGVLSKTFYTEDDLAMLKDGWKYFSQNRYHYILINETQDSQDLIPPPADVDRSALQRLLGALLLPICLCFLVKTVSPTIAIFIAVFCLEFSWSTYTELYEMNYMKEHHAPLPYNKFRYFISVAFLFIAEALFILIILWLLWVLIS